MKAVILGIVQSPGSNVWPGSGICSTLELAEIGDVPDLGIESWKRWICIYIYIVIYIVIYIYSYTYMIIYIVIYI